MNEFRAPKGGQVLETEPSSASGVKLPINMLNMRTSPNPPTIDINEHAPGESPTSKRQNTSSIRVNLMDHFDGQTSSPLQPYVANTQDDESKRNRQLTEMRFGGSSDSQHESIVKV